jgi:hypothetical protein
VGVGVGVGVDAGGVTGVGPEVTGAAHGVVPALAGARLVAAFEETVTVAESVCP